MNGYPNEQMNHCPKCGEKLPIGVAFCPKCGIPVKTTSILEVLDAQQAQKQKNSRSKRTSIVFLLVALCIGILGIGILSRVYNRKYPAVMGAQEGQEFEFFLNEDGESYTVVGRGGYVYPYQLVIPDTYEGLPVTAIGERAFEYHTEIESLVLGMNITEIGYGAFEGCEYLYTVTWNDRLQMIGERAFQSCVRLSELFFPVSLTMIADSAFYGCEGLNQVIIPQSVTRIGVAAFIHCCALESLVIEDAQVVIEEAAFSQCYRLTDICLGYHIVEVGKEAFRDHGAEQIAIPLSLKTIGEYAFAGANLHTVVYDGSGYDWCSMNVGPLPFGDYLHLYWNDGYVGDLLAHNPLDGHSKVNDYVFSGNSGLAAIFVPTCITEIGEGAFYRCFGLERILYGGTKAEWEAVPKGYDWNMHCPVLVYCSDSNGER